MWPLRRINTAPPSPRSRSFCTSSSSSFKDIQSLCSDDCSPSPPLLSPPTVFHRIQISASSFALSLRHSNSLPTPSTLSKLHDCPITLYFTSLRVVRKTYEDSRAVRSILRGYRFPIDERDLSMDSRYVEELQEALGDGGWKGKGLGLGLAIPCLFIGRRCVRGAEEVRRLHESGELREMIAGGRPASGAEGCGACGGMRYVVCGKCHGSGKVYVDKSSGFRCCKACNVNGLSRCPLCFPIGP